ncbi:transcription factor bHLH52-like [Vicia villosa]|uniref:transcription factor bHLH52-like n=1 Tax=Vicia villosa TaxID=3911 RepID=UPI00273AC99F|nr:transcription factor bHLH52-like [Vicia villosa]
MGFLTSHYNNNYSNSYPSHQTLQTFDNSETITFQHHHEQQQQHQQNYDFSSSFLDETLFFPSPSNFYSNENNNYYYPCEDQLIIDSTFSCDQNDGFVSMNDIFPNEENLNNYVNNLPCPKRQKLGYEETLTNHQQQQQELLNSANYFVDEFIANPFSTTTLFEPEAEPEAFLCSNVVDVVQCEKKVVSGERTISTQSIAARERRRKITEKTQELGKLVPGGPKMNTAEMLSAAANYVRFLQAQVGMLQVMETFSKEEKEPPPSEDLHKLVVSPFVQEKLYSEEKCFISKGIITTLANNVDVRSKPSILQGLKQLVGKEIDHEDEKIPKQE